MEVSLATTTATTTSIELTTAGTAGNILNLGSIM